MEEPSSSVKSLRVLVVDDEDAVLEVLSSCLKDEGHEVETARDGVEGLNRYRNGNFDIVLTDRIMPGMRGDQLASAIKQITPHIPVVMVTGVINPASAVAMKKSGVDAIVKKPFSLASLRNAISEACEKHMAGRPAV